MVEAPFLQGPSAPPAPHQGAPGGSLVALGGVRTPRGRAGPPGASPLPRVLEPAASNAAHVTALDHAGAGGQGYYQGRPYVPGVAPVPVQPQAAMRGGLEESELFAAVVRIRSGVGEDGERVRVQDVKGLLEKEGIFVSASQVTTA